MANTIIRPEILYSFYAVLYSMPTIRKLDKQIIAIQKKICGLQDWWYSMTQTPYKGPIRNLQEYIEKRDQKLNLQTLANSFPNISKWTHNSNIDNPTSTDFWIYSKVTNSQITCLLKFCYNQYMGNARKQLFFGPILYLSITCSVCNSLEIDTWPHVLLSCTNPYIHAFRIKCHNKLVSEIRKLLVSSSYSCSYILMNAGIHDTKPPDNTVPHCNVFVRVPNVIVMHNLNQISCVFVVSHTTMTPLPNHHPILSFNILNSPIAMTDSPLMKLPPSKPNMTRSSIIFVQEGGMLRLLL
jgi:hypothetical protein